MSKRLYYSILLNCLLLISVSASRAQNITWTVQSPLPNTTVGNEDLLISLRIDNEYHFGPESQIKIFLNNQLISGILKVTGNKLHLLYSGPIRYGKNTIQVETFIVELNDIRRTEWSFQSGQPSVSRYYNANDTTNGNYGLEGVVVMDYRKQFLSGPGQNLRQEPEYTATTLIDAEARYKNATIPVRVFLTSNNKNAHQRMNYLSVGYRNTWLETDLGDMNPTFDELVLSGVRVRGARLMLKYRASSIQVCHGQMTQPLNGTVQTYVPGTGSISGSLINDSQYVAPGVFKRTMSAARLQIGSRNEVYKVGISAFTAKDDTASIVNGLLPKQNIAGGMDMSLNLFRKSIGLDAGAAASILTNDISNGVIDKETLALYNIKTDIDPKDFEKLIIMNASTVPTALDNDDFLAYYGRLRFNNKYQRFSIEYKKNGALYNSLGNPYLRNNYAGIFATENFSILKRKISVGLVYQNYSNNLNDALPAKVKTQAYRGNVFVNIDKKLPTLYLNYMHQKRDGKSNYESITGVQDVLNSVVVNMGLSRTFWNIDHYFYAMLNVMDRQDLIRTQNDITSYTVSLGLNETFSTEYNLNAEIGTMSIKDANGETITNILTYTLGFNWLTDPKKYTASILFSNNHSYATMLMTESNRLSAILRFDWSFWKGMNLMIEGGYQPFRDETISTNNYNDSYIYIRYSSDLNKLLN